MKGILRSFMERLNIAFGGSSQSDPPLSTSQLDEQAAFFAAMRADIDDDAPRLMYADWLDEQGGPSRCARAEFIRSQCSHRISLRVDDGLNRLKQRDAKLLRRWRSVWEAECPILARTDNAKGRRVDSFLYRPSWSRGFPEELRTNRLPEAAEVTESTCLGLLNCWSCRIGPDDVPRLESILAKVELPHLTSLWLSGAGVGDEVLCALAESQNCPRLVVLWLAGGVLTECGVAALSQTSFAPTLSSLWLDGRSTTDEVVAALARSPAFASLRTWDFGGPAVSDVSARALAESPYLKALQHVRCVDTKITADGRAALFALRGDCEFEFLGSRNGMLFDQE